MIFSEHFTHDTSRFFVPGIGTDAHVVHGIQDAAMDGFQTVAGIRQGARYDHAHGVIEVGCTHLGVNVYLFNVSDGHKNSCLAA